MVKTLIMSRPKSSNNHSCVKMCKHFNFTKPPRTFLGRAQNAYPNQQRLSLSSLQIQIKTKYKHTNNASRPPKGDLQIDHRKIKLEAFSIGERGGFCCGI